MTTPDKQVWNFGAGPSVLPRAVLEQAQAEMLDYQGTGMSIIELSHRTPEFQALQDRLEADFRRLLSVPDNYRVIFVQGGASTQFSGVVYNLLASRRAQQLPRADGAATPVVDYLVTGGWSSKAAEEARKLGADVNLVVDSKKTLGAYRGVPDASEWRLSGERAAYVYYCANETVDGVEMRVPPQVHPDVPIVCDMSSDIMSYPVDVSRFGVIYAGVQKNMGAAGLTVVIIRDDLLERTPAADATTNTSPRFPSTYIPLMLDWTVHVKNGSLYNTPPMFSNYITALYCAHTLAEGGVTEMERRAVEKSTLIYDAIAASSGFYRCPVDEPYRSRMNIPFRLREEALEKLFLQGAEARHMRQLKGHRSVGGIRASVYNALPVEAVHALVAYMHEFRQEHQQ
ncbi:putative phosphoserine aminotransferase [Thamnocephalis sphaerospora]|uniref:phosphoserine transaminase n=1 Tax=Thamnocephalis sphaerospora TaxID=78915 RepID=A0A4P9XRC3_9FUNG|nr:putative phosphoserine aminotransferase [Thamnocephalis sphaerospora]|eukprot:RKP08634.1 putative phosphoserine aminotransferase [Thamnocephalis sphaerospora]